MHAIWITNIALEILALSLAVLILREYFSLRGKVKSTLTAALAFLGVLLTLENTILIVSFYMWSAGSDLRYSMPSLFISVVNLASLFTLYYVVRI
ncbi:hypothetical protein HS1genome_0701 [Sulfodiicoccus acidiphilus]|uniref:Uncharacterized protein n=1 Tax=Sulfodiicoccus acidiphilus TaxID=1670455 RepID=A0A348B2B0_9CREN|nr:hypothetical protein [Sulfodiicoccus acidiphilus]BBD72312.1 hypothetical protein HS1genome_0701 [Sulfodiicoccus acidiphilus]GGT90344.1 hypothetical protein GCM10007116_05190 [Sulfodiicoccus acidiphilus]